MHISLVHNAAAGTAQKIDADALAAQIREHGHEVRPCETSDLDAALAPPVDLVAVAGGDGTVPAPNQRKS